jgi:hypothetical protein
VASDAAHVFLQQWCAPADEALEDAFYDRHLTHSCNSRESFFATRRPTSFKNRLDQSTQNSVANSVASSQLTEMG